MSVSADALRRLAALNLPSEAMAEVLSIFADMQAAEEDRLRKQRERKARSRDRSVTVTGQERDTGRDPSSPKESPQTPKETPPIPSIPLSPTGTSPIGVKAAFDAWNAMAERTGLPKAKQLTETRRAALKARLADSGVEGWQDVLNRIEASGFLRGENDRGWACDFDFAISQRGFWKIAEGKYERVNGHKTGPPVLFEVRDASEVLAEHEARREKQVPDIFRD